MVPREHLWRQMEKLKVPSEYMLEISPIYEKVSVCVWVIEFQIFSLMLLEFVHAIIMLLLYKDYAFSRYFCLLNTLSVKKSKGYIAKTLHWDKPCIL